MLDFLGKLFESDFMPHGYCFAWRPDILWTHVFADALIVLSYYVIPIALIYLVRTRRDLAFNWMFSLFGLFILSCGTTHLLAILTLWHPVYRLEGVVKAITAAASLPTAFLLVRLMPQAVALPSPKQLREANEALVVEVAERGAAQKQFQLLNTELERRVQERTADLEKTNHMLRESNERLLEAEHRYRELFQNNPMPMWVRDPETGQFLAANPAAQELYGYSEEEFLSMTVAKLHPDGQVPERPAHGPQPVSHKYVRKNGAPIYAEVRYHHIRFGSQPAVLVVPMDMTERRALEEQLRHSQKMEAVGRLAGGIAHDFNNLLTVILGYANVVHGRLKDGDPLRPMVEEIQRAGEKASSLTGQLLAFSRKQITQPRTLDLNRVMQGMKDILQRLLGEDVDLAMLLDNSLPAVKADEGQLSQILMNLAVNARDAMPTGGKLTIETKSVIREREDRGRHGVRPAGRYAVLTVSDTGVGMDTETQSHMFEPFFTTKELGKGTGLGLATVYGIVQQHGGWIDVYSEPGHGSSFKVYFPESTEGSAPAAPAVQVSTSRRTGTILLVEDQAAVRMLAEDVLAEAGHHVLAASNGRAALQLAEKYKEHIDLLITDVVMPEMSGPELAAHLFRLRPGLTILYISGYTDHALLHRGAIEEGTAFLQKPFLPETLVVKVDSLMRPK